MNNIKKVVLIIILALFLIIPSINVNATVKPQEYDVKISYGIGGKFKAMRYIPINVEVNALENDFNGEVEIRVPSDMPGSYDAYSSKVSISKGESKTVIIPVKAGDGANKLKVLLLENDNSVYESKVIVSNGRVTDGNLFVGLLTDDATALGYLGSVKYDMSKMGVGEGKLTTTKLDLNILDNNNLNIDGLDVIIINNYNMANLKKEHYDTLKTWVNRGGMLIIGSGANEAKTVKAIDKEFLKISSEGVKTEAVNIDGENLNLALSKLNINDSKVKVAASGNELVYVIPREKGEILISTFDLGVEPFLSSKVSANFIKDLIGIKFEEAFSKYGYGGYGYYGTQTLLNNIPVNKVISTEVLGTIMAIYVLVIGFLLYFVLKKINKRDYTWAALPIIAIIFSFVIYGVGSKTRVKDVILNQVNILSVDDNGKAAIKGYLGIGTKYKTDILIEKPQDLTMNYLNSNNYYYGPDTDGNNYNKLRVKTTYENNNSYFTFENSEALEMKGFEVNGKEEVVTKLEGSFNLNGGNLNGTLVNKLESDISKVLLIAGQNVWDLGEVKQGEELKVDNLALAGSSGIQAYSDSIMQDYYNARWNNKKQLKNEKFNGIVRFSNVIGTISNELIFEDKPKLIAITDMPVEYDINFGNKSISKFDSTAIVQNIDIDFRDKDGNINFPEGYFRGIVNTSSPNVHLDEFAGYIFGQGDIVFDYVIDKNIKPIEITVKPGTDRYGSSNGDLSGSFVYNFKTKEYESFNLSAGFQRYSDLTNYVENNTFRIKLEVNDSVKGGSMIPKIAVKGSEK